MLHKKLLLLLAGLILLIAAGCLYCFTKSRVNDSHQGPQLGVAETHAGVGGSVDFGASARFSPEAWRPKRKGTSFPVLPRDPTAYDDLLKEISMLMTPFNVADPRDRAGNLREREASAMKLLDLLKSGPRSLRDLRS